MFNRNSLVTPQLRAGTYHAAFCCIIQNIVSLLEPSAALWFWKNLTYPTPADDWMPQNFHARAPPHVLKPVTGSRNKN